MTIERAKQLLEYWEKEYEKRNKFLCGLLPIHSDRKFYFQVVLILKAVINEERYEFK